MTSAGPFGFEYTVIAVGVGYSLLLITLFSIFYAFPISLISSELTGIMPSRHGQIIWGYRAFYKINPKIGDFIGFINAANVVIFWLLNTAILPIILIQYLMTITGPLSSITIYFIKLGVILSGLILNTFNFSLISYITTFLCIITILPFFIAFFWTLPQINPSTQWLSCHMDWSLAITTCIWEFAGFESLGNIVNEIGFEKNRLYSGYLIAIIADAIILYIPILSTATLINDECSDWFDGVFAVGYAQLSISLEYSIAIGSVAINWCIYITAVGIVSRMLWAMAQPYFEIKSDGRMVISEDDDNNGIIDDGTTQIAINIFPQRFIGELFDKTGSPIYAVIVITLIVALTNIYLDFDELVEFNLFTYFIFFGIELMSFLILKHFEPNTRRIFSIPFGLIGAWITVLVLLISFGICFVVMVINDATLLGVAAAMNFALICYYIVSKSFCHRMHQNDILPFHKFEDDETDIKFDDYDHEYAEIQPLI